MPAVSICVPTYNGAAYLAECLESIAQQTFADFEVVIVDDCSTDSTVAIANEYAARHPNFRVVRNAENCGLVRNWKKCLEYSSGEWIKFVFQDDIIASDCLARLLDATSDGHVMVSCARHVIFEPGTNENDRNFYLKHQEFLRNIYASGGTLSAPEFSVIIANNVGANLLGEPTAVLLHKSVFHSFGPFNSCLIHDVDNEYWARIGTNVGTRHVADPLASFRVHSSSATATNNGIRQARKQLDPLILRHDFAFSDSYKSLRNVAAADKSQFDFVSDFWNHAYQMLLVQRLPVLIASQGGAVANELAQVYAAYPRFANFPARYRFAAWLERNSPNLLKVLARVRTYTRRILRS